jgi:hypothetical protein
MGSAYMGPKRRTTTCEDIEEQENDRTQSLPDDIEAVIMSESEFQSLSTGGEMEKKQSKQQKEKDQWEKMPIVKDTPRKPNKVSLCEQQKSRGIDISKECQPTFSKIRVEDLVTDKDEVPK